MNHEYRAHVPYEFFEVLNKHGIQFIELGRSSTGRLVKFSERWVADIFHILDFAQDYDSFGGHKLELWPEYCTKVLNSFAGRKALESFFSLHKGDIPALDVINFVEDLVREVDNEVQQANYPVSRGSHD